MKPPRNLPGQLLLCPVPVKGLVAGVDEAGRGCLAGPVVAAATILPRQYDLPCLDDSKLLSASQREVLEPAIKLQARAWSIGLAWPREIDRSNVLEATLRAMTRAVLALKARPQLVLVDGNCAIPALNISQRTVVDGDHLEPSIAAASVLAKTFRDRLMDHLDKRYPGYGFSKHKGYGTPEHLRALEHLGPCVQHRMSFRKVRIEPEEHIQWLPGI